MNLHDLPVPVFSRKTKMWISNTLKCVRIRFPNMIRVFLICLRCPGVSKEFFGGKKEPVQTSRNHRNDGFEASPISKSNSYKTKMDRNNSTELSGYLFNNMFHKNNKKTRKACKIALVPGFARFFRVFAIFNGNLLLY